MLQKQRTVSWVLVVDTISESIAEYQLENKRKPFKKEGLLRAERLNEYMIFAKEPTQSNNLKNTVMIGLLALCGRPYYAGSSKVLATKVATKLQDKKIPIEEGDYIWDAGQPLLSLQSSLERLLAQYSYVQQSCIEKTVYFLAKELVSRKSLIGDLYRTILEKMLLNVEPVCNHYEHLRVSAISSINQYLGTTFIPKRDRDYALRLKDYLIRCCRDRDNLLELQDPSPTNKKVLVALLALFTQSESGSIPLALLVAYNFCVLYDHMLKKSSEEHQDLKELFERTAFSEAQRSVQGAFRWNTMTVIPEKFQISILRALCHQALDQYPDFERAQLNRCLAVLKEHLQFIDNRTTQQLLCNIELILVPKCLGMTPCYTAATTQQSASALLTWASVDPPQTSDFSQKNKTKLRV